MRFELFYYIFTFSKFIRARSDTGYYASVLDAHTLSFCACYLHTLGMQRAAALI